LATKYFALGSAAGSLLLTVELSYVAYQMDRFSEVGGSVIAVCLRIYGQLLERRVPATDFIR
jgi:hypothetical protein